MKNLIIFLILFIILTLITSFVWFSGASHYYYVLLKNIADAYLYIVEDGVAGVNMGTTSIADAEVELAGDWKNEKIMFRKTFRYFIGKHEVSSPQVIPCGAQYMRSLTMNMLPMIALMTATPLLMFFSRDLAVISPGRRLVYFFLALLLLSLTHFFHIFVFYYSNCFPVKLQDWEILKKLVVDCFIFMEALGRPIAPLVIWLLFYNRLLFRTQRGQDDE